MNMVRKGICALLMGSMVAAPIPAVASDTITCESRHGRYNFCRIDTDGKVELVRQISSDSCREGRSWGYEDRGVWVDRGCSGEFRVGRDSKHDKHAAIAAGVVGIALIAALAARNSHQQHEQQEVQPWAIGSFNAYDRQQRASIDVDVNPGGVVNARARGEGVSANLQGNRLSIGSYTFRVQQSGNGFHAIDESDASHELSFQRNPSGY